VRGAPSARPQRPSGRVSSYTRGVQSFDALVVGAGPAGSSTAIHLARAGARVLLADRARFPRDKPCGGGLTGRALKQIPVDPSPVVERDVDRFELRLRYGRSFSRSHDEPLIRMTQRRRLDAFLAEQAGSAGADFRDGVAVEAIELDRAWVSARVGGEAVRADVLVGADGANGVVARALGIDDGIVRGVAIEGNVALDLFERDLERTAVIELATVPGGYGWVFPKGDHANLGVGGWGSEGPRIREHLARLVRVHGLEPDVLTGVRGHRLPMRRLGTRAGKGRVLLVGDAAGLVDPLSGDGMYEAFVSARLAAEAIVSGDLDGYSAGLSAALDRHAAASWAAKRAFDRYPRTVFAAARAPGVFAVVAGLLCGDVAHPADARGVARGPLKLIARLAG
jgi:geranylgeranyl reductase family protein